MPGEDLTGETLRPRSVTRGDFTRRGAVLILCAACTFYGLYTAVSIYKTSFIVEGQRYFCLIDDAMISMRYARNWVDGHGLTWNPGELVEGYSNFLWTAVMAAVHLLPLEDHLYSLAVQVLCALIGLGYVWGTYALGRAVRLSRAVAVSGAVVTALYYPLTLWNVQGMETGLQTCLAVWAAAACARSWRRGRFSLLGGLLLGALLLTRPDGIIIVTAVYVLFSLRLRRVWAASTITLAIALLIEAAYWLWRWRYYDDFWPNTYYLKLGIPLTYRIGVLGLLYIADTIGRLGVLFLGGTILTLSTLRGQARWELIGVFLVCLVYMLWIGGDAWPYDRFVCPAMPFAALGVMHGVALLVKRLGAGTSAPTLRPHAGNTLACALLLGLSLNFAYLRDWLAAVPYYRSANQANVLLAQMVQRYTAPEARVAVFWAGSLPYFARCYTVDMLGKSDPHVAREAQPVLKKGYRPGHNKFDMRYSLHELQADMLIMPSGPLYADLARAPWFREEFRTHTAIVGDVETVIYVRRDSTRLRL